MRPVDADAILYTHKLEQKAIGKDWGADDLATAIMTAPTIRAIPIEWLCNYLNKIGMEPTDISEMIFTWRKEQEAR